MGRYHGNLGLVLWQQRKLDEATSEFRAAVRLDFQSDRAHSHLSLALSDQGELDDALAELREALRLNPDRSESHNDMGIVLRKLGRIEEAVVELREAIRLKPDGWQAHNNLGEVLTSLGQTAEAISEFRVALRLKPDSPELYHNVGITLRRAGSLDDAAAASRRALELVGQNHPLTGVITGEISTTARHAAIIHRLANVLNGVDRPRDDAERTVFAQICYDRKLFGASARLWTEVFHSQPKLADDMNAQYRYNAACSAALAGSKKGKDEPPLLDVAQSNWRKKALDWLKSDIGAWSKLSEGSSPQKRQAIAQTLQQWKADPDLAGLREAIALSKLPEDEQKACRAPLG